MANLNEMDRWQIAQEAIKKSNALPRKPGDTKPGVAESITDYLPFRFENPLSAMQKAYTEAGGGAAGVGAALGNRVAAGVTGAVDMAKPDTEPGFISGFKQGLSTPTKPVADNRSVETQNQPPIGRGLNISVLPAGGITASGVNTSGRAGFSNRIYRDTNGNVIASGISDTAGRGGFTGADTDEQAAKALQDRAEQNEIAQFNIANMNRAAEAERDLRATRLGISRDTLDRMEGRDTGTTAAAAQSTTYDGFDPLAMPGDSFQDTRARQAKYDQAVEQVLTGNAREQKGAAATLAVLNDLREKNIAAQIAERKAETGINPVDMNKFLLDQQKFAYQQGVDKSKFLLDQEKFNYQQGLDKRRLTLDEREMLGKQASRDLERQKYTDEARKAFVSEYYFPDENAPQAQIAADIFEMSQATGGKVPPAVVARFYEQAVKELGIDYGKGGPKDPTKLNEKVMAMITKAYQEK